MGLLPNQTPQDLVRVSLAVVRNSNIYLWAYSHPSFFFKDGRPITKHKTAWPAEHESTTIMGDSGFKRSPLDPPDPPLCKK